MATDDSYLYDSIEVERNNSLGGYGGAAQSFTSPKINRGRYDHYQPGVSDSFDYHYVDANGHSLQTSVEFNPMQQLASHGSQWNYNGYQDGIQNYGYAHLNDDRNLMYSYGSNDGYMDHGGDDAGMFYDSIDASANNYEPYPYSNRFVDANADGEYRDPSGRYYNPSENSERNGIPITYHNPMADSIVRDSLEVGNDMSRYEDVDASYENFGNRRKHFDRKSTVNESTMSFKSQGSQGLMMSPGSENKPFFNPDVEAHQHAINIQSSWRGYNTRQEYQHLNQKAPKQAKVSPTPPEKEVSNSKGHDYNHHATVIQSSYRGYRVRKKNKEAGNRKDDTTKSSHDIIQNQDEAATVIQAGYRGYKSRRDFQNKQKGTTQQQDHNGPAGDEKMRNDKATVIQSSYRGYKARKELKIKKNTDIDDTIYIQGAVAGRDSRNNYEDEKRQHDSATVIQANYRGYRSRKQLKNGKQPQQTESDSEQYADRIQGAVKGKKVRIDHGHDGKKENDSAVVIQSNYRGYRTRKQMKERKVELDDDATKLQGALNTRKEHLDAKEDEDSATVIQGAIRGRESRQEYEERKRAHENATVIQASYRGYKVRKNQASVNVNEDATLIQGVVRGRDARKEVEATKEKDEDATKIQASYQEYKAGKGSPEKEADDEDATLIQGAVYGQRNREELDKAKEREENAAIIQAGYRGYKARKEMLNFPQLGGRPNNLSNDSEAQQKRDRNSVKNSSQSEKHNEEKSLEAAWDRNREMARKKATSSSQSKGQSSKTIGNRKYTEYLEHNKWAQRQDKRRAGEPVSRLPTMAAGSSAVHNGNVNKKDSAPRPAHSKSSNVSFSDPYYEHESRNYPKSPLPPAEYSDTSSVTSEEDSMVQKMERERLRSQILKEEKKQKRKPGEVHSKETLQAEIMNGKKERKLEEENEERMRKPKHEKYGKPRAKQIVRNYSSETLDSPLEDSESLYEFDPNAKRVKEYKLKGYRRKGKWIKPRQQSDDDDELNSMEDETSEDYEREPIPRAHGHPYASFGYPYGVPQYPFPMQNGMGMPEPPHVAFVPVPWNSMHPLEQTLLASQLGPAMQMPVPPGIPPANTSTSIPREKEEQQSKLVKPKVAPGKDFVEKNKTKAVTREHEKGSYKQLVMKQTKRNVENSDEILQEPPVKQEVPKMATKKKEPADMIATKTSINDGGTVKVDINLNIPPEQLAAMLGLDPRKIGIDPNAGNEIKSSGRKDPSPTKDISPVRDRSPIRDRNFNENAQVTHRINKGGNPVQKVSPSQRKPDQSVDQERMSVIKNEKGLPTKQKEPNPYKKIPPITTNHAKSERHRKDRSVSPKAIPQHRPVFYKPYTLDDYKALNLDIKLPVHLGPEHEKIEEKRKVKDRQESYAKYVREQNMTHMQTTNKFEKSNEIQTKLSRRKIGIEYSKSVPRPKQLQRDESDEDSSQPMNEQMQRIEELKRRHEQDKNAVAKTQSH